MRYQDLAADAQQLTVSLDKYIALTETVTPVASKTVDQDFALSPVLPEGKIRIVLTWARNRRILMPF